MNDSQLCRTTISNKAKVAEIADRQNRKLLAEEAKARQQEECCPHGIGSQGGGDGLISVTWLDDNANHALMTSKGMTYGWPTATKHSDVSASEEGKECITRV